MSDVITDITNLEYGLELVSPAGIKMLRYFSSPQGRDDYLAANESLLHGWQVSELAGL